MKKTVLVLLTMSAWGSLAAVPPAETACRFPRRIGSAQEVTGVPADQVQWNCLNVSGLAKNDLLAVADAAPSLSVRLSESPLNKADLIEAQQRTKLTVVVNSRRFNRVDIQDLQRAGVNVAIQTFGLALTVPDYLEIASTGPVTLDINSKSFTKQQILDFAKMDGVKVVIDPASSGLTSADIQEVLAP